MLLRETPAFRAEWLTRMWLIILKCGAGEGSRTLVFCLEGSGSTIELHPRKW